MNHQQKHGPHLLRIPLHQWQTSRCRSRSGGAIYLLPAELATSQPSNRDGLKNTSDNLSGPSISSHDTCHRLEQKFCFSDAVSRLCGPFSGCRSFYPYNCSWDSLSYTQTDVLILGRLRLPQVLVPPTSLRLERRNLAWQEASEVGSPDNYW